MSDPEDPEGKFSFSHRATADAGNLSDDPELEGVQEAEESPATEEDPSLEGTVDGDDLDIEELTGIDLAAAPNVDEAPEPEPEPAPEPEPESLDEEVIEEPPRSGGGDTPVDAMSVADMEALHQPSDTADDIPASTMALPIEELEGQETESDVLDEADDRSGGESTPLLEEESAEQESGLPATMMLDMQAVPAVEESEISDVAEPQVPTGYLDVAEGPDQGTTFDVDGSSIVVGRGLDSDIVLNDSSVSRKHFRLERGEDSFHLVDLGSGNGSIVNGARVQEIRLTEGATIEAGTTTLVWRDGPSVAGQGAAWDEDEEDAARTRVGDLAAVEVDPSWNDEREQAKPRPSPPRESPLPKERPAPRKPQPAPASPPRGGLSADDVRTIVWASVAVVVAVLAFVLIDRAAGLGILFRPETGAQTELSADEESLLTEGMTAFKERRWYDARSMFRSVLKRSPELPAAKEAMKQVEIELAAWRVVEDADKHLDEDQYKEAIESLATVPDTSSYYTEAQALLRDARDEAVEAALSTARRLADEGDTNKALDELKAVLALVPGDTDALAMEGELRSTEQAGAPPAKTTKVTASKKSATRKKKPRRDKTAPPKSSAPSKNSSSGPGKAALSQGLSLYGAGNFAGAIDFFDGMAQSASSKRIRSQAQRLATAITRFDTHWRDGRQKVSAGKVDAAIKSLKQARKVDQTINGAYQTKVKRLLARQYAWKAEKMFDLGKFGSAGKLARSALDLDPNVREAQRVQTQVQSKADGWLSEARSMAASNPDKAMELLSRVLSVFRRSDKRYQSAYRLMNQLGQDEDD